MKTNYSMIIQWSDVDQIFLVTIPEFVGRVMMPCTEGNTHEEAAKHGLEVIETFLEIWEEEGKSIPEPRALEELVAA
jgi:predicted RNase H-like HicB family nuclease